MDGGILSVIDELAGDATARAALDVDPQAFLVDRGLEGFTAADLRDAIDLSADALPVQVAQHLTTDLPDTNGLDDRDAMVRLLNHAAEAPEGEEGVGEEQVAFGEGSAEAEAAAQATTAEEELEDADGDGDEPEQGDAFDDPHSFFDDEADTGLEVELEEPEPEPLEEEGVESEELPDHWGDGHTDAGGLDPHDLGGDIGHLG